MQQFAETRLSNRCTGGKGHEDDNGKGLGGNQRQVMAIITSQLCDVTEKIRPFGLEGQAVKAIPEKAVVDEFVSATAGDLPNKKREARVRALNGIIARRLIARQDLPQGAMVWLLKE